MLGELLLEQGQPATALIEFETSQQSEPNRLQGLYGAARAAELAGNEAKARAYYAKLAELGKNADADRPEVMRARAALVK